MKYFNLLFIVIIVAFSFQSCRKDFDYSVADQAFRFSRDTVYLDTVFTTVRSETYSVKVYNQQDKDVLIPNIRLADGANSYYRINVDGVPGTSLDNVPLRAQDSLYVFVEVAPDMDISNETLLVEDLLFQTANQTQTVKLVSLVEDAEFFFPSSGNSEVLINADTDWNSTKSKIIFGDLKVTNNATLTIAENTKVYFHKESSLTIDSNSSLVVNGTLNNEVVFRGDRQDARHDTLPANWEGIKLKDNSTAQIRYAKIKGGFTGIEMKDAQLTLENAQFSYFVTAGIVAINSEILAANLLVNHCGESDIALFAGGDYAFYQSTFANYYNSNFSSGNAYSVYLSDNYEDRNGNSYQGNFTQALFSNCILYGNRINSFSAANAGNFSFQNCLIKYSNNDLNPPTDSRFINCLYNENPNFKDPRGWTNDIGLKPQSPARMQGGASAVALYPMDYYGITRSVPSTLGAIE